MEQSTMGTILALRAELHRLAERSGEEIQTKAHLMAFLRRHTSLRLEDRGRWFCAVHEEPEASEGVALRADMDALPFGGGAAHLCGHDGHCAALAGLGLLLEGQKLGRNVLLIFQHAEETGAGGRACAEALKEHGVSRIYAFHSIPGWPEGAVLLRQGTFACASLGMTLSFAGAPTHAAYPENGRNPGYAAARLIGMVPALAEEAGRNGLAMATLIGAEIGSRAFGSAAASASVWLTLRAWRDEELQQLISSIEEAAQTEAERDGVTASVSFCDIFPATVNDGSALERVRSVCSEEGLATLDIPEPFHWSEDFGHYGAEAAAAMVGIGAGEDWPQLHTERFEFNDRILPTAMALFGALARRG